MSEMHEVTTAIRGPNTELPHPQRLSNGFQSIQTNGVGDANDKNNNQEKSNKNVLKKAQVPPPLPPKSKRQSNGIDNDNKNRSDNIEGDPIIEAVSASSLPVQSVKIDGGVQKSLPKTNRSTLSSIRDKGQAATHEDGASVCTAITAVNVAKTNCDTESAHSRTSNECHNGKSLPVFFFFLFTTQTVLQCSPFNQTSDCLSLPFLFVCEAHVNRQH